MAQALNCDIALPFFFMKPSNMPLTKSICIFIFQCFAGTQNVSSLQKGEAWKVNVRIHGCDLEQGYLCGTMEALNVPLADTPVSYISILSL
jgi:hypothetical protein